MAPMKVQPCFLAPSAVPARSSIIGSQTVCPDRHNFLMIKFMVVSFRSRPAGNSSGGGTVIRSSTPAGWKAGLP